MAIVTDNTEVQVRIAELVAQVRAMANRCDATLTWLTISDAQREAVTDLANALDIANAKLR